MITQQGLSEKQVNILRKAEELFAQNGFNATSVRDIARAAKVNMAMISYYFGSKEKLIEVLFTIRMKDGLANTSSLLENKELGPMQKLEKMIDGYTSRIAIHTNFFRSSLVAQLTKHNKVVLNLIYKSRELYVQAIEQIVDEGLASGQFKYKYDPVFFLNLFNGTIMQAVVNMNFHLQRNKVITASGEFEKDYFRQVAEQLKLVLKRTLGYEENK